MKSITLILFCWFVALSAFAATTNDLVVVTAPAKFEQKGEWAYLIIDDGRRNFDFVWSMPHYKGLANLRSNQVYTFVILEEEYARSTKMIQIQIKLPPGFDPLPEVELAPLKIPRIIRIAEGEKVVNDREICGVHQRKMERREVPIVYGLALPGPGEPSSDVAQKLFPHRNEIVFGGCVVTGDSPKTEKTYVCGECKKAYEKWKSEHPASAPAATSLDSILAPRNNSFGK